ncbi:MAG: CvpA family protein [Bacteroidales bacterium]|nr:CvpA family protein [Bacteroidales bacterium]
MNFLDIILILPVIWFAYKGFTKGFIIELTLLVALVLGVFIAINFSYFAADFLTDNTKIAHKYISIIAFVITFIAIVIAAFAVGKLLEKVINLLLLGFINKIAGCLFGILKAAFILSVIIFIINSFDSKQAVITKKIRENSILYKPIASIAPYIIPKLNLDKLDITKENVFKDL